MHDISPTSELEIIARAGQYSDRVAIEDRSRRTTYAELLKQSADIAQTLLCNNISSSQDLQQSRIAILLPAGPDYVAAQWGIWRAGGVAVPLSLSASNEEWQYALDDAGVNTIITDEHLGERIRPTALATQCHLQVLSQISSRSVSLPNIDANRRAMILYTSGTTARPKGVVTTHANIQAQIETLVQAWQWQPSDHIPLFLPLHHIHGIINVLSCALWSGATVTAYPSFDAETVLSDVAGDRFSLFMAVPTIYVRLIQHIETLDQHDRDRVIEGFAKMRLMVSGSAALPASVHKKWTDLTTQPLLERYGMTEIGMALSNPYIGQRRPGTVGQALPNVTIRLVDESGEEVHQEGQPGEIQVRGPSVFREYWNRPQATVESFTDGWFRTGDIAALDDGYYRILGRNSVDIIKSGGYKLSALEIESVILDHPDVDQCAVVGIEDDLWGEAVAVAVVVHPKAQIDLAGLKEWMAPRVSHYKLPKRFLVVDQLPRNAMGKIQKPSVKALF